MLFRKIQVRSDSSCLNSGSRMVHLQSSSLLFKLAPRSLAILSGVLAMGLQLESDRPGRQTRRCVGYSHNYFVLFSSLLFQPLVNALSCFCKDDSGINFCGGPNYPCSSDTSSVQQCCLNGDTCLSNGFCFFTHPTQTRTSGYYLGGCTDPNFQDPRCPQQCSKLVSRHCNRTPL